MPLIHVMILLFLGVHSIIIPHAFAHLSLRTGANTTLSFPTASYYGQITKSESFLHTGILHPVHFSKGCKLLPPRSPTPGEDEAIQQGLAARSILWISAGEAANNGGCMSYGTINDQIVSYIQRLPGQGWPLPLAILYHSMARNEDDVFGGPMPSLEMYTSRDVVSSESMPPLDALMVSADHGLDLMRTMGSTNRTWGIVDLQLEPGPWNRVHFHPAYLTYEYILLTANALLALYGCARVIRVIRDGQRYGWCQPISARNLIFIIMLLGSLMLSIALSLRKATTPRLFLIMLIEPLQMCMRLNYLNIWRRVLNETSVSPKLWVLKVILIIGVTGVIWDVIWSPLSSIPMYALNTEMRVLVIISSVFVTTTKYLLGLVFIYYAWLIRRHIRKCPPCSPVLCALKRVEFISAAGFIFFFIGNSMIMLGWIWGDATMRPDWYACKSALVLLCYTCEHATGILRLNLRGASTIALNSSASSNRTRVATQRGSRRLDGLHEEGHCFMKRLFLRAFFRRAHLDQVPRRKSLETYTTSLQLPALQGSPSVSSFLTSASATRHTPHTLSLCAPPHQRTWSIATIIPDHPGQDPMDHCTSGITWVVPEVSSSLENEEGKSIPHEDKEDGTDHHKEISLERGEEGCKEGREEESEIKEASSSPPSPL